MAVMGFWCAGVVLLGAFLQLLLPPLDTSVYGRIVACYGFGSGTLLVIWTLSGHEPAKAMQNRESASVLLFLLAVFTALGTLIVAPGLPGIVNIHHSIYFSGLLGTLGGMQASAILSRRAWQMGGVGRIMLIAHGGVLLILSGAAIDVAFGSRGVINLHEGSESAVYSKTVGLGNVLTGETGTLAKTIRLNSIETQYHPRTVYLRLFRNDALAQSWEVAEGTTGRIGDATFRVVEYIPDASFSRNVIAAESPTGKAAAFVTVQSEGEQFSDWLFSEEGNYGFIRRPDGSILVRFFMEADAPVKTQHGELQINASTGEWRIQKALSPVGKRANLTWTTLPDVLKAEIDGIAITVSRFLPQVVVEDTFESRSEEPRTPIVHLEIERDSDTQKVFMSPLLPVPLNIDEKSVLISALTEQEPRVFTSSVTTTTRDGLSKAHTIRVNQPLRIGACKIYQADFDRLDQSYSGFQVNCAPGTWVVKTGMGLMILGLLASAVWGSAQYRRKDAA